MTGKTSGKVALGDGSSVLVMVNDDAHDADVIMRMARDLGFQKTRHAFPMRSLRAGRLPNASAASFALNRELMVSYHAERF